MITHTVVNPATNTAMITALNAQQTALLAQRSGTHAYMGCSSYTGMPPFVAVIILVFFVVFVSGTFLHRKYSKLWDKNEWVVHILAGSVFGIGAVLLGFLLMAVVAAINTLFFM